jgi:F-box/leucine-rich repeat protein 2/20
LLQISPLTTRLTRLDLCGCALISEKAVCRLVRASPRLQCLLIEGCLKLGDETVSCIGETCGGLTELDVSGLPMLSPDPVARLRLPRLRSLRLADCAKLTAAGVADCVLSCEALQQLCISRASLQKLGFTDVIAAASASLCRLRKLHVDGCAVTDENVTTLSKHCSGLTSLNLSSCAKIGDGAICAVLFAHAPSSHMAATATTLWRGQICRSCTQLVELDLSYLKLGDPPLLQLADSCTLLRKVRSSRRAHSPSTTAALDSDDGNRTKSPAGRPSHELLAIPMMGVVASHLWDGRSRSL